LVTKLKDNQQQQLQAIFRGAFAGPYAAEGYSETEWRVPLSGAFSTAKAPQGAQD
jgi:hypothetical protein